MKRTDVSIVIVNKNDRGIARTLQNLSENDHDVEIVVVDASRGKLKDIKQKFPNVKWISFENKNYKKLYTIPEQRNIGVKASSGSVIVFIDANCVPYKDWLNKLIEPILNQQESIVGGATFSQGKKTLHDDAYHNAQQYVEECPTINLAFTKKLYNAVNGFDERFDYGSDVDFSWRVIGAGYKIRFAADALITHDWGNKKQEFKREYLYGKARARLYLKHTNKISYLFSHDPVVLLYPLYIVGLFLTPLFLWYPALIIILILKNRKNHPIRTVSNHLIYGTGVIVEVGSSIISSPFDQVRRLRILAAYILMIFAFIESFEPHSPPYMKPLLFLVLLFSTGTLVSYIFHFPRSVLWPLRAAVSIILIIFSGLFTNTLLPRLGIHNPLQNNYVGSFLIILSTTLMYYALKKSSVSYPTRIYAHRIKSSLLLAPAALLFPVMTIAGAIRLNNGTSANLSVIALAYLGILVVVVMNTHKRTANAYKWTLFCIGLGILAMYTVRGNYINGSDIQAELYVFDLTSRGQHWSLGLDRDTYNATLSLTILPTIINNFLHITHDYIYKLYYPIITALTIPVIYSMSRKYLNEKYSFLVGLFYTGQAQFMQQLPALARQQVAFLFFFLIIYFIVDESITKRSRNIGVILLGVGTIISHYSTAYIMLACLIFALLIKYILQLYGGKKLYSHVTLPSIMTVVVLTLFTLLWYGQLSKNTASLPGVISSTVKGVAEGAGTNSKSSAAKQALFGANNSESIGAGTLLSQDIGGSSFIPRLEKISLLSSTHLVTPNVVKTKHVSLISKTKLYNSSVQKVFKLFLVIGLIGLIAYVFKFKDGGKLSTLMILSISSAIPLVLIVVLPVISQNYNFERLYQQIIPILGIPMMMSLTLVWKRLGIKRIGRNITALLVLSYLFAYSGVFSIVFGGDPTLQLSNSGIAFEQFYKSRGEVLAAGMLQNIYSNTNFAISTDTYGKVNLYAKFDKTTPIGENVFEGIYKPKTLVSLSRVNKNLGEAYLKENGNTLIVNYPLLYIDRQKDLTYTNQLSSIYR
jgi:uncharacterized membrane protein/GT2 family glycosyltransferase